MNENNEEEDIYKTNETEEDIYKVDDYDDYDEKKEAKEDLKAKLIKYGIIAFVVLVILVFLLAIFSPKKTITKVTTKDITLTAGDKYSIDYSKGTYTWTSSNQGVAKVSDDGEIIALKSGETTITVKSGKEAVSYIVHVEKLDDATAVTNVKMEKNTIEVEVDKTYDMKVVFTPSTVTNVELTWDSSDETVATVKDGVIKAIAPGTCMITVRTPNGNLDYCLVKVVGDGTYNPVESITISSTDVTLNDGSSYNLSYEVVPSESVNLITWESSNDEIATVENGVVYAHSSGEVTITAKSGDISQSVSVKVGQEKVLSNVVLDYNNIEVAVGEGYTLSVNDDIPVVWSCSNESIVAIDQTGGFVAIREGQAVITATADDGSYDECVITVANHPENNKIALNTDSLSISTGSSARLIATVTPSNNVSSIEWFSSNTNVATVTNGEVIAKAVGTTTITAQLPNGQKAECVVNVSAKVVDVLQIKINVSSLKLKVGKSSQLSVSILPSTATNKTITWSSSNTKVATVDKNGKVTAKSKGSAKIYARSANGVVDDCAVIVQ